MIIDQVPGPVDDLVIPLVSPEPVEISGPDRLGAKNAGGLARHGDDGRQGAGCCCSGVGEEEYGSAPSEKSGKMDVGAESVGASAVQVSDMQSTQVCVHLVK